MIQFNFKLNNKTIKASVPEDWTEVKLKHILAMESEWSGEGSDMIGLLAAFTGENYNDLENAKGNLWEPLFQVMSFVFDAPNWKKISKPKTVNLGNKIIKPPKNLMLECFGQKVLALNLIANEKDQLKNIPDIISIYLQPCFDGKFVADRVADIKPLVLEMPAFQAMPYGLFFLKKLLRPRNYGLIGLMPSRKIMKSLLSLQRQVKKNSISLAT